ncbi:DNA-nicking Smr family endonuclease [Actimicrobium sp. GrIS 1.19]|uniref:Smr/MutS family protein n=1 Tax=Actimicrobium sp. GrIS 1.19 TaxID=3071708 RepID=UPI002E00B996|nr:DNA-nicking Smr family endonuclease [Actimicrobium sp. GrIS 1.19]
MPAPIKDFAALARLRTELKAQQEARALAEAQRVRLEQQRRIEADLFRHSVGTVAPLAVANKTLLQAQRPEPIARHHLADEQAALAESLSDDFSIETLLDTDAELSFARNGIGPDTVRKLRRGHWVIQSQLDLHGLRTDEAREALSEYLRAVGRRGLRCVRIIHGKGLGSINKEPVLKSKVRNWLVQKEEVLAFCQAKAADGGSGALVVLLKS